MAQDTMPTGPLAACDHCDMPVAYVWRKLGTRSWWCQRCIELRDPDPVHAWEGFARG